MLLMPHSTSKPRQPAVAGVVRTLMSLGGPRGNEQPQGKAVVHCQHCGTCCTVQLSRHSTAC